MAHAGDPNWDDSKRCPRCGALNREDAEWCSQCYAPFDVPAPVPVERRSGAQATDGAWVCSRCRSQNPVYKNACGSCGTPFYSTPAPAGASTATAASSVTDDSHPPMFTLGVTPEASLLSDTGLGGQVTPFPRLGERIARAFRLMGAGWDVLKKEPELLLLPVAATGATYFGSRWVVRSFFAWLVDRGVPEVEIFWQVMFVALCLSFFISFVNVVCHSAVVQAAIVRLRGGNAGLANALGTVVMRLGPLTMWSLIVGTVSLFLRGFAGNGRRPNGVRTSFATVSGVAWSALTFFVVPTIICERTGPLRGVKRSAALIRNKWGESLVGSLGIGVGVGILAVPLAVLVSAIGSFDAVMGLEAGLFSAAFLTALGATFSGIFGAAIYHYTITGEVLEPFTQRDLDDTFHI